MPRTIKINVNGKETSGYDLQFNIGHEDWNEYKLLDGGLVRVKTTVTRIIQAIDGEGIPLSNDDGSPLIIIQSKLDVIYV